MGSKAKVFTTKDIANLAYVSVTERTIQSWIAAAGFDLSVRGRYELTAAETKALLLKHGIKGMR